MYCAIDWMTAFLTAMFDSVGAYLTSNLCVSFVVFSRYGGIYLDSDIIVVKPLSSLNNSVGLEDQLAGSSLNGAVMVFRKDRYSRHSSF